MGVGAAIYSCLQMETEQEAEQQQQQQQQQQQLQQTKQTNKRKKRVIVEKRKWNYAFRRAFTFHLMQQRTPV